MPLRMAQRFSGKVHLESAGISPLYRRADTLWIRRFSPRCYVRILVSAAASPRDCPRLLPVFQIVQKKCKRTLCALGGSDSWLGASRAAGIMPIGPLSYVDASVEPPTRVICSPFSHVLVHAKGALDFRPRMRWGEVIS